MPYMAQYDPMKVIRSSEFELWLSLQTVKMELLIESRIFRIIHYDHFGDARYLGSQLSELRWDNGLRVYLTKLENRLVLILSAGLKNAQKKDIKKARILLQRYTNS